MSCKKCGTGERIHSGRENLSREDIKRENLNSAQLVGAALVVLSLFGLGTWIVGLAGGDLPLTPYFSLTVKLSTYAAGVLYLCGSFIGFKIFASGFRAVSAGSHLAELSHSRSLLMLSAAHCLLAIIAIFAQLNLVLSAGSAIAANSVGLLSGYAFVGVGAFMLSLFPVWGTFITYRSAQRIKPQPRLGSGLQESNKIDLTDLPRAA